MGQLVENFQKFGLKAAGVGRLFVCGALVAVIILVAGCSTASTLPDEATPIVPRVLPTRSERILPSSQAAQAEPTSGPTVVAQEQPTALPDQPEKVEPGQAVVIGQLVNGTAGASVPSGVAMTLYALPSSFDTVIFTRTAQADGQGQVRFDGLDVAPGTFYALVAEYQGATYFTDPRHFPPDQITMTLPLKVYEITADSGVVRVDRMHVILDVQPGGVQVSELLLVSNTSDRAYLGGDGTSLHIKVPSDAIGLQFQDGELGGRYLPTEEGFADTEVVPPGEQVLQVLFSFVLPYDGKSLDVALPASYPVQNVNLLVPDAGVQVSGAQLVPAGSRQTQGGAYLNFTGAGPLAPGEELSFHLSGAVKEASAPAAGSPDLPPWLIAGVAVGVLMVIAGTFVWWRSRGVEKAEEEDWEGDEGGELADEDALLDAIADLDDAYETGQIAESEYKRKRASLKAALMELMSEE